MLVKRLDGSFKFISDVDNCSIASLFIAVNYVSIYSI